MCRFQRCIFDSTASMAELSSSGIELTPGMDTFGRDNLSMLKSHEAVLVEKRRLRSLCESIVSVYEALFLDFRYTFPELEVHFEMDLERLRRAARESGIHAFVVDLPALGKHLDRCLAKGFYEPPNLPFSRAKSTKKCGSANEGNVLPVFLGGLFKEVFEMSGSLKSDPDVEAILFLRQCFYLSKKVPLPFSQMALDLSVKKLFEEDAVLPKPEGFWMTDAPSTCFARTLYKGFSLSTWYGPKSHTWSKDPGGPTASDVLIMLNNVSSMICHALGEYIPSAWPFKHGPGAISQVSGPSNKYAWYGWSARLESVYPIADHGFHDYLSWADAIDDLPGDEYVPFSRLVAVPKTYEKPRLIAAEPSEHQWCQQNTWSYFRERSADSWISNFVRFSDQTLNQELCLKGSLDGTLLTMDLSSASDRVSCHAVGQFFRSNLDLLNALRASRTHIMRQKLTDASPYELSLNKFSTMGSANTFPVEALIFLGITISAALVQSGKACTLENIKALSGSVAVFGDDIIAPVDCRELLQQTLEVLDFKVNSDKTFSEGNFRESCGVDAFRGVDVTPVYLRSLSATTPEAVSSIVDTANNFYSKFFVRTSMMLESTLPAHIATVSAGSGAFGIESRLGTRFFRKRWNSGLQREEVRMLTLKSAQDVHPQKDNSSLHQYFTEDPSPYDKWEAGVRMRPKIQLKLGWVDMQDC